jgi:rRNA-processing protein CGR1
MSDVDAVVSLAFSSSGRVSGKPWKTQKTATVYATFARLIFVFELKELRRTHLPDGVKAKNWEARMQKTERARAIKKLQAELKDEKLSEIQRRRQITKERKQAAAEKKNIQDEKAKVCNSIQLSVLILLHKIVQLGARRAARLRRKMGRTKKINH